MPSKKGLYIFTVIGLLLGFTLDSLYRTETGSLFSYAFVILFCLLYAMSYNEQHELRLIISSALVALFLSLPLIPMKINFDYTHAIHWVAFLGAFPVFAYAGHCFHYAYHQDNGYKINYQSLFTAVWNTIPLLLVAALFTFLANLLLWLAAFIFKTAGFTYLWHLYFDNDHFRIILNTTLFFIGLAIGQQNISIINSLRFLLLRMMYFLFPFLALISIIYFILYFVANPTQAEDLINPLFLLIPLVVLGILFFNAYYQDGSSEAQANYPSWLSFLLKIYRVVLLLLTLLMVYRLAHGHALDINVVIYLTAIILFSFIYALSAWFNKEKEKNMIQRGNIIIALCFIGLLFLLNIPYMSIAFEVGIETQNPVSISTQSTQG